MNIFLTGNHFVDSEVSEEQVQELIKSFDSPSCHWIVVNTPKEVYYIAKRHIVAILFIKDKPRTQKLLN